MNWEQYEEKIDKENWEQYTEKSPAPTPPQQPSSVPQRLATGAWSNAKDWYNAPSTIGTLGGMLEGGMETAMGKLWPADQNLYPPSQKAQAFQQGIVDPLVAEESKIRQNPLGYLYNLPGKTVNWVIDNPLSTLMGVAPIMPSKVAQWVNPVSLASKAVTGLTGSEKVSNIARRLYMSSTKISDKLDISEIHRTAQRGLDLGAMPTESGLARVKQNMGVIGNKIDDVIARGTEAGDMVDMRMVANSIDDIKKTFSNKLFHDPEIDSILNNLKQSMLELHGEMITVEQAQLIKRTTQKHLDRAYDKLSALTTEAEKVGTAEIRKALEVKYPELKTYNPTQQENIWLNDAIIKSIKSHQKGQMLPGLGLFNTIKNRTVDSPMVKARIGIILDRIHKIPSMPGRSTAIPFIASDVTDEYTRMANEWLNNQ